MRVPRFTACCSTIAKLAAWRLMIGITFNACCLTLRSTLDACCLLLVACACCLTLVACSYTITIFFFWPIFVEIYYLRLSSVVLSVHDIVCSGPSCPSTRDTVRICCHSVARDTYRLSFPQ